MLTKNLIKNKKFIILSFSNLSLLASICFLKKYQIIDFLIFSVEQDGNSITSSGDIIKIINDFGIDNKKVIRLDKKSNYKIRSFLKIKSVVFNELIKIKDKKKIIFISSMNYGFLHYYIKSLLGQNYDLLLDEGITSWLHIKDRFIIIKNLVYFLLIGKYCAVPKNRIIGNQNLKAFFGFIDNFENKNNQKNLTFISLKKEYVDLINSKIKNFKYLNTSNIKILLILGKDIHYKNGVKNMILLTINKLKNIYGNKFELLIKFHPGYKPLNEKFPNKYKGFINIINNNTYPIEFYNLREIKLILSPLNTSLFLINRYNLIDKIKIKFYDLHQSDFDQKLKLAKKMKIQQFHFGFKY